MQYVLNGVVKNRRGGVILQGILASVFVMIFIFSSFRYIQSQNNQSNYKLFQDRLNLINAKIISTIEHPDAWRVSSTSSRNKDKFSCLHTNNCNAEWTPFNVVTLEGEELISEFGSGLNIKGEPCTNFNNSSPSYDCPFFITVKWKPDCQQCTQKIQIISELKVSPIPGVTINPNNFVIDFIRSDIEGTLSGYCSSIGGILNPDDTTKCLLPGASTSKCPAGTYFNGISSSGNKICKSIPAVKQICPKGVATLKPDGNFTCN